MREGVRQLSLVRLPGSPADMPSLDQANAGGPGCWLECDQLGAWLAGHAHLVGSGSPLGSLVQAGVARPLPWGFSFSGSTERPQGQSNAPGC